MEQFKNGLSFISINKVIIMVFSSSVFLFIFLPITLIGYFIIRKELKNIFILCMSLIFYTWGEPKVVILMIISSFLNYSYALLLNYMKIHMKQMTKIIVAIAVLTNIGILFYYKYYDFTVININRIFRTNLTIKQIALPIGISFFTFQGMSYVLDVFMEKAEVQKNPFHVLLYISLFPQLIAGPIVRYSDINHQIENRAESLEKIASGISRFIIGLSKKVLISNSFAVLADNIFNSDPLKLSVLTTWIGTIFYAVQIYYDFSGYSDMAIGLGKILGFDFLENFNYPYISKSITEFWKRWHISLSSWFRDYIYIPLGGNRKGNVYFNLFIVFLITGIWHGASWNFIFWGIWHGIFILIERAKKLHSGKTKIPFGWCYTMFIVLIGWVFFRCPNMSEALKFIRSMFGLNKNTFFDTQTFFIMKESIILFIIASIGSTPIMKILKTKSQEYVLPKYILTATRSFVLGGLLVICVSYIINNSYNPFIYFNF